jgi:hypothetical protein
MKHLNFNSFGIAYTLADATPLAAVLQTLKECKCVYKKYESSRLEAEVSKFVSIPIEQLGNMTLGAALNTGMYSVYVGMTRRSVKEEYLKFLTKRGGLMRGGCSIRGRPILMRDADFTEHFTQQAAEIELGAAGVEVLFEICIPHQDGSPTYASASPP